MSELTTFEQVHLGDIDPNFTELTPGTYVFQPIKAELKTFTYKKGPKTDTEGEYIKLTLLISDNDEFAGRRHYESMFLSNYTLKALRRIQDATGIQQEAGEPITEWLKALETNKPKFSVPVTVEPDVNKDGSPRNGVQKDGVTPKTKVVLNWYTVNPVE